MMEIVRVQDLLGIEGCAIRMATLTKWEKLLKRSLILFGASNIMTAGNPPMSLKVI